MLKEKALFIENYSKDTIKNTTYRYILYFVSFIFFIMFLKFSLNELTGSKNSNDEKYEQISNKLNELERQNEELRTMNQRLLESKYS
jgi:bacteriorhodopsin